MGIVNVTPDSFFDGGRHDSTESAVEHALRLVDEGADILDIGGESTRPGAAAVAADEETRRVVSVVERLAGRVTVPISVDTTKADVARRALDAGASWINDVSAGRFDTAMAPLAAQRSCPVVLMHSRETPRTMQQAPSYDDVLGEVETELLASVDMFIRQGVARENVVLDPGIGFAKRIEDNLVLLNRLDRLCNLGYPLLVGTSRKSFIGHLTGRPVQERLYGSLGSVAAAYARGARLFRVHDVAPTVDMLKVMNGILSSVAEVSI
ncbi:MAG: dihydropteroate synthase [Chitinivibrionales bacterium]|nr:dihydropteroate synthase [Chitinivibrionales bacterium]